MDKLKLTQRQYDKLSDNYEMRLTNFMRNPNLFCGIYKDGWSIVHDAGDTGTYRLSFYVPYRPRGTSYHIIPVVQYNPDRGRVIVTDANLSSDKNFNSFIYGLRLAAYKHLVGKCGVPDRYNTIANEMSRPLVVMMYDEIDVESVKKMQRVEVDMWEML